VARKIGIGEDSNDGIGRQPDVVFVWDAADAALAWAAVAALVAGLVVALWH
jgi:hypothetical protein